MIKQKKKYYYHGTEIYRAVERIIQRDVSDVCWILSKDVQVFDIIKDIDLAIRNVLNNTLPDYICLRFTEKVNMKTKKKNYKYVTYELSSWGPCNECATTILFWLKDVYISVADHVGVCIDNSRLSILPFDKKTPFDRNETCEITAYIMSIFFTLAELCKKQN